MSKYDPLLRAAPCSEDITYLGMDKLSFFFTVDFSQIPVPYGASRSRIQLAFQFHS
jgi:hypothetical protein